MSKVKLFTSPPEEPGYYWGLWEGQHRTGKVILLCYLSREKKQKYRYFYPALEKHVTHWFGPISPPEMSHMSE